MEIPEILKETSVLELKTPLPKPKAISIDKNIPTCIYNFYNLDPIWKKESKENIPNIQVYVGEFNELITNYNLENIHYKEHPLNEHYKGAEESRDWMFDVQGYYPSFFAFWKKCKKQLIY